MAMTENQSQNCGELERIRLDIYWHSEAVVTGLIACRSKLPHVIAFTSVFRN